MYRFLFAFFIVITTPNFSSAQDTVDATNPWKTGGSAALNFTRVGLQNWSGGGQSSISLSSLVKAYANYRKNNSYFETNLDIAYGISRLGGKNANFKKSDDQIILISKYGHTLNASWSISTLLDFRSQFAPGFEFFADTSEPSGEGRNLISRFLAPGYLLKTVGVQHKSKYSYTLLSPLTGKTTFVMQNDLASVGAFGVAPGKNIRVEFGALIKAGYKRTLMKNVDLNTNINLFASYKSFGNIDVNWDLTLQFKINDYLSATYTTLLIYDDDVNVIRADGSNGAAIQFKDVLSIGLLYKFSNKN